MDSGTHRKQMQEIVQAKRKKQALLVSKNNFIKE